MSRRAGPVRFLCCCLCLALLLSLCVHAIYRSATDRESFSVLPETDVPQVSPPAVSAASYALFDPVGGVMLAEGDAHTRRPMASTTKIMTALLVLEALTLDATVTVPAEAVGIEGSSVYLFAGEQITVRTLLYALMLSSANDAAVALAILTDGSVEAFAARMNRRAAELGLTNTHFCNPHGLPDPDHYSTARDMAYLAAEALKNDTFAGIVAEKRYAVPQNGTGAGRLFLNHNRLLRTLDGAIGVKTGYTRAGGRCLVSAARRDGLTLIAVTLRAPDDWRDHTALLEWGFSQYTAFAPALPALNLPVVGGSVGTVALMPASAPKFTLPAAHAPVTCTLELPRFLYAGITQGEVIGRAVYRMGTDTLCEIPLLAAETVPTTQERVGLWTRIRKWLQG